MLNQTSNSGQTAVPGRNLVRAFGLDVQKKSEHRLSLQIIQPKICDGGIHAPGKVQEEKPQAISVGPNRMGTGTTNLAKMALEIILHMSEQRIGPGPLHGRSFPV